MTAKFINDKGVMKRNPVWEAEQAALGKGSTVANPKEALPIISSPAEIREATIVQANSVNPLVMSVSYDASMEIIGDDSYLQQFSKQNPLTGNAVIEGLGRYFSKYEVPIGLVNKLLALMEYSLNMIIDDSGSMRKATDSLVGSAGEHVRSRCHRLGKNDRHELTRWEEAEDRLHTLIDILQYIPTRDITISFLNRHNKIVLSHAGKTPEEFAQHAHREISRAFDAIPTSHDLTPTYRALNSAFNNAQGPTMHYLFTDGEPSDATTQAVGQLVLNRANPAGNPLTFVTCTGDDAAVGWIGPIEAVKGKFIAALDDFGDEKREVTKAQGPVFPYSRGMWLISHLVAAINPDDLDALDEKDPMTKKTIDDLLGRVTAEVEYNNYFHSHPSYYKYSGLYEQFKRTDLIAKDILAPTMAMGAGNNQTAFFGGSGLPTGVTMSVGSCQP